MSRSIGSCIILRLSSLLPVDAGIGLVSEDFLIPVITAAAASGVVTFCRCPVPWLGNAT